jgi:hypothetical protein
MKLFDSSLTVICRSRTLFLSEASLSLILLTGVRLPGEKARTGGTAKLVQVSSQRDGRGDDAE